MSELDFIKNALNEDIGRGDLFSKICDDKIVRASVITKDNGVFSGKKYISILLDFIGLESRFYFDDGEDFNKGDILLDISGSYLLILKVERTLLNILQHSSGIATNVKSYARILQENLFNTIILDTRKTRPNLRDFEKYSVLNGGARNHRLGLDDCLMLKDTNLSHISNLANFIKQARAKIPWTSKIEIECDCINTAKEAMEYGVDIIMCDNMNPSDVSKVVSLRNEHYPHILLEASGNISKANILDYAKTGVDAISIGSLIHQATWVDLSLKMA